MHFMRTPSRNAFSNCCAALVSALGVLMALPTHAADGNRPCFEVQLEWAVPGHIPMDDAPFVVYDHDRKVLYRGRSGKDGVAHICADRLPNDATIAPYPDEPGGNGPIRIFPEAK